MGEPLAMQVDLAAYSRKRPSPRTIYRRSIKFTVEIFFQTLPNFPFCLEQHRRSCIPFDHREGRIVGVILYNYAF